MAGIAGVASEGAGGKVKEMLDKIRHRGKSGTLVFEKEGTTLGIVWNELEGDAAGKFPGSGIVADDTGPGHFAIVKPEKGKFIIYRDELGVAPMYYGTDKDGNICFASEIKALLPATNDIHEFPPGHSFNGTRLESYFRLQAGVPSDETPEKIAVRLREHLDRAVKDRIRSENFGSWLSGGLDSSAICTLAAGHMRRLKTFSAGLKDAPDLEYAREMAGYIKSEHHEIIVSAGELIKVLPQVIYHLESFDALLVRSSITNYLVAKLASDYVSDVFSGEAGDELFAGYEYLKSMPQALLGDELISITNSLHNTALQRVDRCASAHGTRAHVVFTDPEIVKFAFTIPVKYKIFDSTEKWILRKAMEGMLPEKVLRRQKAKFWEGAGIKEVLSEYADVVIPDIEFRRERTLDNGFIINSKEELYFYRIFKDHFGPDLDISYMGRTSGSPVA